MRALAFLILLCGPVLSAPAAAGLLTWRLLQGQSNAEAYALAAAVAAGLAVFALVRRRGLLREVTVLALSAFWTGWLWFALTDPHYDWTRAPALRLPDSLERIPILTMMLVYLTLYVLAEESRPRRVS